MTASLVGEDSASNGVRLRATLTDVFAGTICSILSVAYCLSYAALIFTGPLANLIAYGVAVTLASAAIGGAVVALRSSLPFAIAGPDSSVSVVLAALVATLAHRLVAGGDTNLLAPTLIALSSATALTGLLLSLLGFTHAGRAIRFIPYPVIGGFLGATGCLMIMGAVQVMTDRPATFANLANFADGALAAKLAAGVAVALVLYVILRRTKSAFILPGVLLAAVAITHIVIQLGGSSLAQAQAAGWLFDAQTSAKHALPWKPAQLAAFPWRLVPSLAGDLIAVVFVTTITLLLNVDRYRDGHAHRGQYRAGAQGAGARQHIDGGARRPGELHLGQPLDAGAARRRERPPHRPDHRGDLRRLAADRPGLSRRRAEIRARRRACCSSAPA